MAAAAEHRECSYMPYVHLGGARSEKRHRRQRCTCVPFFNVAVTLCRRRA
jgi:hypothetical protein